MEPLRDARAGLSTVKIAEITLLIYTWDVIVYKRVRELDCHQ